MLERLFPLFMALLSALVVIYLLIGPQQAEQLHRSYPSTLDRYEHGFAVARTWLERQGLPFVSLQKRFDQLNTLDQLPRSGNLLITVMPHRTSVQLNEVNQLKQWLARGNRLLILWHQAENMPNFDVNNQFLSDLGFDLSLGGTLEQEDSNAYARINHPLLQGVDRIEGNYAAARFVGGEEETRLRLSLMEDGSQQPVLWMSRFDRIPVWFLSLPGVFSNDYLIKADNARLLFNLANFNRRGGGAVIFDDFHQGVSALYDANMFYSDARLHNSLWFIALFWLLYIVGHSRRFVLQPPGDSRPQLLDHVNHVASLLVRRLTRAANGRRLLFHFYNEVRAYSGLPQNGEAVFELLEKNAQVDRALLANLKEYHRRVEQGRSVNMLKLSQTIQAIRKHLL